LRQHRGDARRFRRGVEVARHAAPERASLADVQDALVGRDHPVHAWSGAEIADEILAVERRHDGLHSASPRMGPPRATATATAWAGKAVEAIDGTGIGRYMFGGSNSAIGSNTRCWADYASAQYAAPLHAFTN